MSAFARPEFPAEDPAYAERVRGSFARQAMMAFIGANLPVVEPGYCEIHLPYKVELTQQHGFFHGGSMAAVADSAAGYAAYSLMPPDASVLTVEYKVNMLRPGDGEKLIAVGTVVKPGRTLTVATGDVYVVKDGRTRQCLASLQTLMRLDGRADAPAA